MDSGVLKRLRETRCLSQKQVADAVGTDVYTVCKWESGKRGISPYYRKKLCEFFAVSAEELGFVDAKKEDDVKRRDVLKTMSIVAVPTLLKFKSFDLEWFEKEARILWKLHYAQSAHEAIPEITEYIQILELIYSEATNNLKRHMSGTLCSLCRLAATIYRDQGLFDLALTYANQGIKYARANGPDEYSLQLLAASQYTRGVVNHAWGSMGKDVRHGHILFERAKIQDACTNFEQAAKTAGPLLKGIVYLELSRAKAQMARSPQERAEALSLLEAAEPFTNIKGNDDYYDQIMLYGDIKGIDKNRLHLGRAKTYLALGLPEKVIDELNCCQATHLRRRGWSQIFYVQALLQLGDKRSAIQLATQALLDCREAGSISHLARMNEIYKELKDQFPQDIEVIRLGKLLAEVFPDTR